MNLKIKKIAKNTKNGFCVTDQLKLKKTQKINTIKPNAIKEKGDKQENERVFSFKHAHSSLIFQ